MDGNRRASCRAGGCNPRGFGSGANLTHAKHTGSLRLIRHDMFFLIFGALARGEASSLLSVPTTHVE
jgi:hypothetical protein